MTIEENIESVLLGMVRDLELDSPPPVAWPNVSFTPAVGTTWLRVRQLPNVNERLFVKGSAPHLRQGILQIDVMGPLDAGPAAGTAVAGAIAAAFAADREGISDDHTVKVRVQRAPDVGSALNDGAWWMVPVSIRYEVLA